MPSEEQIKLAYQVIDHIEAFPESWDQRTWAFRQPSARPECRTAYCVAGWTCVLSGDRILWEDKWSTTDLVQPVDRTRPQFISIRAGGLLGLTDDQADELFDPGNSLSDVKRKIGDFFGPRPGDAS